MTTEIINYKTKNIMLLKKRRLDIIQNAVKLFQENGYDKTTMENIAYKCGISKGAIYNYVDCKENIVWLIADLITETRNSRLQLAELRTKNLNIIIKLKEYIREFITTIDQLQDAYIFMNHVVIRLDKNARRRLLASTASTRYSFERLLKEGVEAGEFDIQNVRLCANNIFDLSVAWALDRWLLRKVVSLEEYITAQTDTILKGILNRNRQIA